MAEAELEDYIKTQKTLGVHEKAIHKSLIEAGYTENEFKHLLERHRHVKPQASSGGNPAHGWLTLKHLLYLNLAVVISFGLLFTYLTYDYNSKFAYFTAEQEARMNEVEAKAVQGDAAIKTQLSSVEGNLKGEISTTKTKVDSVSSTLNQQIQDYNYQALSRDSALQETIQKSSNRSLSELSSFSAQLEHFRKASVDFSPVIPLAVKAVVTIGKKGSGFFNTAGSGVVINEQGYIVTNWHVVDELRGIDVKMHDGKDYKATLIGKDEDWDIAVIKLTTEESNFDYLDWADSGQVSVGDHIIAVGNPVGFDSTVTEGIISNTKRLIPTEFNNIYYFQTDVAINSGNSGGPLVDKSGDVVGLATLKYVRSGYEGLSFALRSNDVQAVVLQIIQEKG